MADKNVTKPAADTQQALNKKEDFILKYKNLIIGGVIALIVIVVGIIFFKNQASAKEEKAATAAYVGQDIYFANGVQYFEAQDFERALKGDSTGYVGFLKIADEYSSTKTGNLANLYCGLCYAHMGQWQEAANYLEKYDDCGDMLISPAALGALGNAYANLNQLDKAVETLKKAADKADNLGLTPLYLVQAGQILESQGKKADALKLYQQVKAMETTAQQTPFSGVIEEYIERASN